MRTRNTARALKGPQPLAKDLKSALDAQKDKVAFIIREILD
jgi:hypothetical protein